MEYKQFCAFKVSCNAQPIRNHSSYQMENLLLLQAAGMMEVCKPPLSKIFLLTFVI